MIRTQEIVLVKQVTMDQHVIESVAHNVRTCYALRSRVIVSTDVKTGTGQSIVIRHVLRTVKI